MFCEPPMYGRLAAGQVLNLDGVSAEEWNYIYDVNVRGPMFCCREALDKFENGGSIVFISSIAARWNVSE